MLFGGSRLGPRLWLGATAIVVFAAHFSALWIVMANFWMQTPAGYKLVSDAGFQQAQMTDFLDVMFTPSFVPRILHVYVASWTAGAALVLSVSAWYILKKRREELAKSCFRLALPFFVVFAITNVVIFGANQAIEVTNNQEGKLAAIEGLWNDTSCAPLFITGWVNESAQTTKGLSIPCLLSFLSYGSFHSTVQGLNSFPSDTWAPVNLAFQVYHLMFDLSMVFALIAVLGAGLYLWKQKIWRQRWLLWVFVVNIVLAEVAIIAGWWTAEVGRQPWVVWNLLRTADGVSPAVTRGEVIASLTAFVALYALLLALFLFLLNARIQRGPEELDPDEEATLHSLPDSLRDVFRRHVPLATTESTSESETPS